MESTLIARSVFGLVTRKGFARDVKEGNLKNAIANIQSGKSHTVTLYADGDIKDGWHHLNALMSLDPTAQVQVRIAN